MGIGSKYKGRSYPPVVVNVDARDAYQRAYWPSVEERDWCGEFHATVEYVSSSMKEWGGVK